MRGNREQARGLHEKGAVLRSLCNAPKNSRRLIMFRNVLLIVVLALLGCDSVRPPIEGRNDPYDARQIHFATDELRRDTAISRPQLSRDKAGLLFVTIPIRSAVDKRLYIDYRVTFFDDNRRELSKTSWFSQTLEANTRD